MFDSIENSFQNDQDWQNKDKFYPDFTQLIPDNSNQTQSNNNLLNGQNDNENSENWQQYLLLENQIDSYDSTENNYKQDNQQNQKQIDEIDELKNQDYEENKQKQKLSMDIQNLSTNPTLEFQKIQEERKNDDNIGGKQQSRPQQGTKKEEIQDFYISFEDMDFSETINNQQENNISLQNLQENQQKQNQQNQEQIDKIKIQNTENKQKNQNQTKQLQKKKPDQDSKNFLRNLIQFAHQYKDKIRTIFQSLIENNPYKEYINFEDFIIFYNEHLFDPNQLQKLKQQKSIKKLNLIYFRLIWEEPLKVQQNESYQEKYIKLLENEELLYQYHHLFVGVFFQLIYNYLEYHVKSSPQFYDESQNLLPSGTCLIKQLPHLLDCIVNPSNFTLIKKYK